MNFHDDPEKAEDILHSNQTNDKSRSELGGWMDIALQTSLTLAISVLVGVFGGIWLDKALGTTPLLTIIGTLWGVGGGTFWIIMRIKRFAEAKEEEEKEEK
ncbi:MAG: AtpZ/AtpI family protein [Candidatus Electryonea clarkiae]|nr:AtpZ/AtpI family protein [Candidatus Electryonea clarkiae]